MSDASPILRRDLGDGQQRRLFLSIDELRQIRRETGRGFYSLYTKFADAEQGADIHEVEAILRLALIGGGCDPREASQLVAYYCSPPRPMRKVYIMAHEVLGAAWNGSEGGDSRDPGGPMQEAAIDGMFDEMEANMLRAGLDPAFMRNRSIAEIQQVMNILMRRKGSAPAPDQETFNAIKRGFKR